MVTRLALSDKARRVLANWYEESLIDDTPVYLGSFFGWLFGLSGQHAVTLNGKVHITRSAPDIDTDMGIMLVGHELFHVEEQRRRGWWPYIISYVLRWRPRHARDGRTHPMERDAYARGDEVWRILQGR